MALDIGALLFIEILGMSAYPGAPFSGNIISDIVMFFFIPTVFIIYVIYILVKKMTAFAGSGNGTSKMGILLSIAFYLFIVFSPYHLYSMFAYLAGPYFLFLLIVVGLLYFFIGHFGPRQREGYESTPGSRTEEIPRTAVERAARRIGSREALEMRLDNIRRRIASLDSRIRKYDKQVENMETKEGSAEGIARLNATIKELEKEKDELKNEEGEVEKKLRKFF